MTPPRILVVVGTRPEAIKMAPVVAALRARPQLRTRLLLTGQHRELVDQVLEVFGLEADRDLGIMREGQSLYDVAHRALDGLRDAMTEESPDLLLVQGDTASVFFGALVSFFEGVRVGHVEAGLRSRDLAHPFPEEGFRRLTSVLADLHFAPTEEAVRNLLREGVPEGRIHRTGNPVVDALLRIADADLPIQDEALARLLQGGHPFILLTAHRRESFGEPLRRVFRTVHDILDRHPEYQLLYPVHPNPHVREPASELLGGHPRVHLVDPLSYPDLVRALRASALALTDSGGIQEEAPTFGTPVVVLREVTERPEGIAAGVATLAGTDPARILAAVEAALGARTEIPNPYGDGRAGERIARIVARSLLA